VFLDRYERYCELFKKSEEKDRKIIPLVDCIPKRWRRVISARNPEALGSDEALFKHLEKNRSLTDASQVRMAFSKLHMKMSVHNPRARLAMYDADFFEVKERCGEVPLKDKALCKLYVAGICPESVKKALEDTL